MPKYTNSGPTTRPPADTRKARYQQAVSHGRAARAGMPRRGPRQSGTAIALGRRRLREIYLAQIKKAKSDYFDRVKRAADRHALLRTSPARANREGANG